MCMDPKYGVPKRPAYQYLLELAPLTSKAKWRKLKIEDCPEEDQYLDCILRYRLEEFDC